MSNTSLFIGFDSWFEVLLFVDRTEGQLHQLYYHAPLDRTPTRVEVVKVFKNGKLRVKPSFGGYAFTADKEHTSRFVRRNPAL